MPHPILFAVLLAASNVARPQAPKDPPQTPTNAGRTFVAAGALTPAARERLQKALGAVEGVQSLEFTALKGGFTVRISGNPAQNAVMRAGMATGFDFRPSPSRSFTANSREGSGDPARLKDALSTLKGVEQVDVDQAGAAFVVRVQGLAGAAEIISKANSAGFDVRRSMTYVASGSDDGREVLRLKQTLARVNGVEEVNIAGLAGGATLTVIGSMDEAALPAAAKSAGYLLKSIPIPTLTRTFSAPKWAGAADEEKLKGAVESLGGAGELKVVEANPGALLEVRGGVLSAKRIVDAAKAAGFELTPVQPKGIPAPPTETERNTPPAFDERINEDLTKVGDLAPDFTLITKDGKSKITLSSFRDKQPVVLIFGSYT